MEQLTATQIAEWEAYGKLDPIGEQRADYRMSYLLLMLNNLAIRIHGKKGTKLSNIEDFLFNWDVTAKQEVKQTPEQIRDFLMSFASSHNKRLEKEKNKTKKHPK